MPTHLGKYITEKRATNPVVVCALAAMQSAYEGASLTDVYGNAITDASGRVWRRRVPTSTEPPYGRVWGVSDSPWADGRTRNGIPTSCAVNVKHTARDPDVAATMASAYHDYVTATELLVAGFHVVNVQSDMPDVEQPDLDEAGDLYHVNQRYRFLLRAT